MSKNLFGSGINPKLLFISTIYILFYFSSEATNLKNGLVGHWEFNTELCEDLSGNGNNALLKGGEIYQLGKNEACIRFKKKSGPVVIPVNNNSSLAIQEGTICFWLNVNGESSDILSFNNGAVQLKIYRGDFQVRVKGENEGPRACISTSLFEEPPSTVVR